MLDQQRKYISETTSKDEQLKKALEEISALNKKLAEERTESEEKVENYDELALISYSNYYFHSYTDLVVPQANIANLMISFVLPTCFL